MSAEVSNDDPKNGAPWERANDRDATETGAPPPDIIRVIFSYLDVPSLVASCRGVCRTWYHETQGCLAIGLRRRTMYQASNGVHLVGHVRHQVREDSNICDDQSQSPYDHYMRTNVDQGQPNRTSGNLPRPNTTLIPCQNYFAPLDMTSRDANKFVVGKRREPLVFLRESSFLSNANSCRLPSVSTGLHDDAVVCLALDLTQLTCDFGTGSLRTKFLERVDLSGLANLQQLNCRGCQFLESLCLPPSIKALDAGFCVALRVISIQVVANPGGNPASEKNVRGIVSLNLRGCGSLNSLWGHACPMNMAIKYVKELDLSSLPSLPQSVIADMLQATTCLESVALRYVATDQVIEALAKSRSAEETLRLVDLAFSTNLTDSSVDQLVNRAKNLERCNLRGCRSVSSHCYNMVPIFLVQRKRQQNHQQSTAIEGDIPAAALDARNQTEQPVLQSGVDNHREPHAPKRRKGDNIFFLGALETKQPASKSKK